MFGCVCRLRREISVVQKVDTYPPFESEGVVQPLLNLDLNKLNYDGQFIDRIKPLRAGVKLMNTTSGLNLGGSLKVCSFTQNLGIFDAFTGTDLNVAIAWLNTIIGNVNTSQKNRMLSGRVAAESLGLCLAVFAGSGGKYLFHRIG